MLKIVTCDVTGESFEVSDLEISLRKKFGFDDFPNVKPLCRFQHLGAFWQHWNVHNRKCDKTGKNIISVFSEDCPYPVWQKDEWIQNANPPARDFDFSRNFFDQAWELFQQSPIPHNFQSQTENCEYTDDWYKSKNCYLCHSGQNNEDCRYCYGCDGLKDVYWSAFSFDSELCADLINSKKCFDSFYLVNCQTVQKSSFLYDCRNCIDCMFCTNLRNKKYCFGNVQYSKEDFEKKRLEWDFSSRKQYEKGKGFFAQMMQKMALHRSTQIEHSQNSHGDFLNYTKDVENSYLLTRHEEAVNVIFSGPNAKTLLDCFGTVGAERAYSSVLPVYSYEIRFCFSVDNSRFCDYSAFLKNSEYCFGCVGLMNAKYHIFNKKYSEEEYHFLREKIIAHMKQTGEWGQFFPKYFAPVPYDETIAGFYWPLSYEEQINQGYRSAQTNIREKSSSFMDRSDVPDSSQNFPENVEKIPFWDADYNRPFQITRPDILFSRKLKIPLPNSFYGGRMRENLQWMPFSGELRKGQCGTCQQTIQTSWPEQYDQRILCEECYHKKIY